MKVAMITPWKVKCGIFTYSENLINALVKRGVEVYVIRLPRFGAKTHEILRTVAESFPPDKVDLIHVQHEYGLYQTLEGGFYGNLRLTGKPIITTMHAVGNWEVDRVVRDVSNRVIVHNKFCARRFRHPCTIIPHGAKPSETVMAEEAKKSLGIPNAPIVGYCGFISSYKGLEAIIEAMMKIPKAALVIAGGWHAGPGTRYIMNLKAMTLQQLTGRCQWLGWVPEERLPTVYGAMDVVVYPSLFSTESGALIMALSHGKAVLASRIAPFIEKEEAGALRTFGSKDVQICQDCGKRNSERAVKCRRCRSKKFTLKTTVTAVEDLRRKIKRLLKSGKLRRKLEEGAKKYAEENSWGKIADEHLELYREVCGSSE